MTSAPKRDDGFIASPLLDTFFLIGTPLLGVIAYFLLTLEPRLFFPLPRDSSFHGGRLSTTLILILTYAHLVIVFFRSHGNPEVFKRHPLRFVAAPLLLLSVMLASTKFLMACVILGVWWDVYHSSLQTFGIARMYDRAAGNDLEIGRKLDLALNLLIYAGPALGGATLVKHLMTHHQATASFRTLEQLIFNALPHRAGLTYALLAVGLPFCVYYLFAYRRYARAGYRVSAQKSWLLAVTAAISLLNWGFNPFGAAFFVMNFFHAVQYFFLIWRAEGRRLSAIQVFGKPALGRPVGLFLLIFSAAAYGVWSQTRSPYFISESTKLALLTTISLMHFWYDGFIWSVRKGDAR